MDLEFKCGLITPSMKENGAKIKLMEEENSGTLMAISMKANGKMTKPMALESTSMSTEPSMKDTGRMIFKTAKVWRAGKMVPDMKVATKKV
jgi:hypothetical protein